MAVSKEEIQRIAALARVRPESDVIERLTKDLNGILEHIRALEDLDLSEAEGRALLPEDDAGTRDPELRPDRLGEDAPASLAPDWRDGFFVVPRLPALQGGEDGESEG